MHGLGDLRLRGAGTPQARLVDLVEYKAAARLEKVEQQRLELSAHSWALSEGLRLVREARLVSPEAEARALQELAKLV